MCIFINGHISILMHINWFSGTDNLQKFLEDAGKDWKSFLGHRNIIQPLIVNDWLIK